MISVDSSFQAILSSWSFDVWIVAPIVLSTLLYVRGWYVLRRRGSQRFGAWQLAAFGCGMALLSIALLSPIETFSALMLRMHMVQHLLLMFLIPPLLWLSAPELPLLCGLPSGLRREWIAPLYRWKPIRSGFAFLTRPPVAWGLFVAATWIWHLPRFYDAALSSGTLHNLEHACFFWAAMLFWWPVVQPYPSRLNYSRWVLLPYLFLAAVQGTVLSGILSFANDVIYDHYELLPQVWGITAIDDQAIAGTLMWLFGMLAYVIAGALVGYKLLFAPRSRQLHFAVAGMPAVQSGVTAYGPPTAVRPTPRRLNRAKHRPPVRQQLPILSPDGDSCHRPARDVLNVPLLGRFLRWNKSRLVLQILMFAAAALVIVDGLLGAQIVSLNLAGVLPWIHWRGFLVLGLLVAGNLFCMACPFKLSRTLGKTLFGGRRHWPRWLRSKWLAVGLLFVFFWAYEVFSLWQSPWWTAWIAVGYFLAAFVVDGFFRGAAFCKYVCPIGQFNFVQSLVSPLEVRVRDTSVCEECTTKECIRGAAATATAAAIPGCELHLYQPRKSSNFDCTFCLDCVHSCPHQNVGILTTLPGRELLRDPRRSGIGKLGSRTDVAALVFLLVFAAYVNAAGMVAPVLDLIDKLQAEWGFASRIPLVTAGYLLGLGAVPFCLVAIASLAGRRLSGDSESALRIATRFSYMLVPLGFSMWLAHYSFHLFTSSGAFSAALRRFLSEFGWRDVETAAWVCSCGLETADWLLRMELMLLDAGLLMSLYVGYRIARDRYLGMRRAMGAFLPWAGIAVILFLTGVWLVFQPMQMRGVMPMGM
ncbi:Putative electron transport protein YccM [Symmachiella dynata]|uniref:Electron transport protein YccM n=1 Tax=Symmachiella dynata TaxID=2527995 RepID=A0A517ZXR3_9PLAN|nr:cytochrome c oxidase assembly protein [Symmachiella dynata]QDU47271.1 Putative electron transport protein YccM [Symmachiella dynata]